MKFLEFVKKPILNQKTNKKEWKRGRHKATPEQKAISEERQRERVKIRNAVSRNKEIDKRCCICGQENSPILHNPINPYNITFLCRKCRLNQYNVIKAEQFRFDFKKVKEMQLKERTDNHYIKAKQFTKEEVETIVYGYLLDKVTIGEYIKKHSITRYQFNKLVKKYKEFFPEIPIEELVNMHNSLIMSGIQKVKLEKVEEKRNKFSATSFKGQRNVVGKEIKKQREKKSVSISELANRLKIMGIDLDSNMLEEIENNTRWIKDFELLGIVKALNIKLKRFQMNILKL